MSMVTLKHCSRCKEEATKEAPLRGLYCVRCHNAYRQASRWMAKAEKRMDQRAFGFVLTIALRKARKLSSTP